MTVTFKQLQIPPSVANGVLRGQQDDIARAYTLLAQPIMNLAMRMLQDRQLAEEVLQDSFIELLEKSRQIRAASAIGGWVRTVAVNHCLMKLRSPWHARRTAADADEIVAAQAAPEIDMDSVVQQPKMAQALGELSSQARAVVWLHDVEGYTHKEIGELMGKTASYSKSQLARAYEKLLAWRQSQQRERKQQPAPATIARGLGQNPNTETKDDRVRAENTRGNTCLS